MRRLAILGIAVLLALFSGAQVLSNALAHSRPDLAAGLSPWSARAQERAAIELVTIDQAANRPDVSAAQPLAQDAVANDLLAGEALALVALGQENAARRDAILAAALGVTRRGRLLNTAAMVAAVDSGDNDALLATLNRTLLLYPSQQEAMIPVLVAQLGDARMVPGFVQLLRTAPPWAQDFYVAAGADNELAANMAVLRLGLPEDTPVSPSSDQAVLRLLSRNGLIAESAAVFQRVRGGEPLPVTNGELGWATDYPPFDWQFIDEGGRFARPASDASALMVSVRAGYGGILARRLIRLDGSTTFFEVAHSLDPGSASRVRLTLECPDGEARWANALGPSPTGMRVDVSLPCDYAWLSVDGRVPAGGSGISGQLLSISIL